MTHGHDLFDSLSPDDQRLVDELVECGFSRAVIDSLPARDRDRAETIMSLFELLEDYPVDDADETLVHATLARIDRHEDQAAARMAFASAGGGGEAGSGRRRIRIPDFISIAAVILIGVSVVWPVTSHIRQRSFAAGCASNLRQIGTAFSQYANDYDNAMPMVMTNYGPDMSWDKVHHAVNLNPLIMGGYCELSHMQCPGHADQIGESFSYRWQLPGERATWGIHTVTVVLGDRNPIIDAARSGRFIPPLSVSLNHGGRGQNTLDSDGTVLWLQQPLIRVNDNIWLPSGLTSIRPGDRPTDPADVFLAH